MATRVTPMEVKQIISTTLDPTPFIMAASTLVDNVLSGTDLSADTLYEIERYLAAHFMTARQQQVRSQKIGDAQETYSTAFGEMLKSSTYGQMALVLDTSGKLADVGKRPAKLQTVDFLS